MGNRVFHLKIRLKSDDRLCTLDFDLRSYLLDTVRTYYDVSIAQVFKIHGMSYPELVELELNFLLAEQALP